MIGKKLKFLLPALVSLLSAIFCITNSNAQSGRKTPPIIEPPSSEKRDGRIDTPIEPITVSDFKPDKNLENYRFIYPTSYRGKCAKLKKYPGKCFSVGDEEYLIGARSRIETFIGQLNKLGEQGYRLDKIMWGASPHGFVKLNETQYEYAWFETASRAFYAKNGFEEKLAEFAEKGFRVINQETISRDCKYLYPDDPASEFCKYVDVYLLEKEKRSKERPQQLLISGSPGWGAKPSVELTTQIADKFAEGFSPVSIFSKYEILLENSLDKNEISDEAPEFQVIRSDIENKMSELSKQGYRLGLINNSIALMIRRKKNTAPVSYVWLETDGEKFEKEFAALTGKGLIYHSFYPNTWGNSRKALIFEQTNDAAGQRPEYKVFQLDFSDTEKPAETRIDVELKPDAIENLKKINELLKQDFRIREIFYSDKVKVLLEREKAG
jgi:hypothetical protein